MAPRPTPTTSPRPTPRATAPCAPCAAPCSAHATSTPVGDRAETLAIKQLFGEYAPSVPISANKSMIGHLTGAAGAVEAVATILTLQRGLIPPTINQEAPDPECDLDYVPNVARPADLTVALSNSFGFGGVNAVLALRRL